MRPVWKIGLTQMGPVVPQSALGWLYTLFHMRTSLLMHLLPWERQAMNKSHIDIARLNKQDPSESNQVLNEISSTSVSLRATCVLMDTKCMRCWMEAAC